MMHYKWFHEVFNDIIKSKLIPVKEFAAHGDVNYARLLQVLKGNKMISQGDLEQVLTHHAFSNDERQTLLQLHEFVALEASDRQQVAFIEQILNNLYATVTQKESLSVTKLLEGKKAKVADVCSMINDQLFKSYNMSLRKKMMGSTDAVFRVNFCLPALDPLLNEVYDTLCALQNVAGSKVGMDIVFYISMNPEDDMLHRQQLIDFAKFIKLISLDDAISLKMLPCDAKGDDAYPYYVYFEDRKIMINTMGTESFVVIGEQQTYFDQQVHHGGYDYVKRFDTDRLNEYLYKLSQSKAYMKKKYRTLRYNFSSLSMDLEFLDEIVKTRASGLEKTLEDHKIMEMFMARVGKSDYRLKHGGDVRQYVCRRGVEKFLEDGVISDYVEIVGPLTEYERLKLVMIHLKKMSEGLDFRMIDPERATSIPALNVIRFYEVFMDNDELLIVKHFGVKELAYEHAQLKIGGRTVKYALLIKDPMVVKAWILFTDTLLSYVADSRQATFNQLKEMAERAFMHSKDDRVQKLLVQLSQMNGVVDVMSNIN